MSETLYKFDRIETAWAAGFFDGEGCVSIHWRNDKAKRRAYLLLQVTQKDRRPLERFAAIFGGHMRGPYPSLKGSSRWEATGKNADRILSRLLPYLSAPKQEQAARVLERLNG